MDPEDVAQSQVRDQEARKPPSDNRLSRRLFLTVGTGLVGALISRTSPGGQNRGRLQHQSQRAARSNHYESFSEPLAESSKDGALSTTLRVMEADIAIREPTGLRIERTRCYNGLATGPTLKLRPGDELRIRLRNELPTNPDSPCGKTHLNRPHCFNTTNIHTHGLHVSPKAPSDDSYLRIEPQTEYQYCFRVPKFHPTGTFWYHAHVHGSTGLQVMNGLAGALIIEEPDDQRLVPEYKDLVWMVQEILGKDAEKLYTCDHPHGSYTVNGKFQPTVQIHPGEIQRWRFINATATPGGYMKLQLLDSGGKLQPVSIIAVDGYPLRRTSRRTEYILPPGGRADFLVQLRRSGTFKLMKRRFQGQARDQVLALIDVGGKPLNATLPESLAALPSFIDPITDNEIVGRRTLRFQICPDQARGDTCKHFPDAKLCSGQKGDQSIQNAFLIDGNPYDPDRTDHTVKLDAAEEWEIVNETGAEHPFHIHTNHFQLVRQGVEPRDWVWQDTVSLPADRSVKIRSRFRDYHGKYLVHCHILLHSDLGMMQNVEVVGRGVEPCNPA